LGGWLTAATLLIFAIIARNVALSAERQTP
jgi:hypothetical protein